MRFVFFNRFYAPDHAATAQLLSDVAEHQAAAGRDIIVVTSRATYSDDRSLLPRRETRNGVSIIRTWTPQHRGGMAGRIAAYLCYYAGAFLHAIRLGRRDTVLIVKTDPPMLAFPLAVAAMLRRAPLVHWVQDLFPEVATAFGIKASTGPTGLLLRACRNWSFRRAVRIVAIGELMAARIARLGIPRDRIDVICNWADDTTIAPSGSRFPALRHEWNIPAHAFVLEYSGNLGRAHEFDTVVGAAERLRAHPDIVFLIVGGGHMYRQLAARVAARGLTSFRFAPYQPRDRLGETIGIGDAHWISLRPEFEGLIVPSKVFGICAAGRPLIAVCAADGELPRMLRPDGACINIVPGDVATLADAIATLAADRAKGEAIGAAGRALLHRAYTRASGVVRWQTLLDAIGADGTTPVADRPLRDRPSY